ncbi:unnamed protein product, partial [Iphiclides podalirius]
MEGGSGLKGNGDNLGYLLCKYRQGRFRLSFEAYVEADKLEKYPDAEIYCGLAECSWNLGDVERGVEWARAAVQAGGGERAGALLARLYLASDQVEAALQAYDQAIAAGACSADTLAAAGALRLRSGDPRSAFQLLGAALAQQPSQHGAALALAAMLMQHGDEEAALARLKVALSAHPACVAAHSNLGLVLLAKRKYVAALTCLQRAACAAPLSARAAHNLAIGLLACKRPVSAFCRLATAASLQPKQPYTVLLLAVALERLGDERADAAYSRAMALRPQDPLLALNVAARHARASRLTEAASAAAHTARLLLINPDPQLSSSLSVLLSQLRDAGVEVTELSDAATEPATASEQPDTPDDDRFAPDEV